MVVQIVGAGLAGLSAAITLAREGVFCNLFSIQPSERAQSVMAEGGINGSLDTMGEQDTTEEHFRDTMKAGGYLADEEAVRHLTESAPEIIRELADFGVPFHTNGDVIQLRNFGGQKKKRTAFAKSSTGKVIMNALIDEVRKWEAQGFVKRYDHHEFRSLLLSEENVCQGVEILDTYSQQVRRYAGPVLLAYGGMNGMFPGKTTGTTANSGNAAAQVFSQQVRFANLEMIQYHPTTIEIAGKRCLVSEAARGEGGRLYIERAGKPWYYMEEKYPELGNLMPRDVVSRESAFVLADPSCGDQIYLDMRHLKKEVWEKKLSDLREELLHYQKLDPRKTPIPVSPGIHYFMGGIWVNKEHETSVYGLYAAGECCMQYHGANRLGGNSLLGAICGGKTAAGTILKEQSRLQERMELEPLVSDADVPCTDATVRGEISRKLGECLLEALGIVREEAGLQEGLQKLQLMENEALSSMERKRLQLGKAMILSALARKESRGAHYRLDFKSTEETQKKEMLAVWNGEEVLVQYEEKEPAAGN